MKKFKTDDRVRIIKDGTSTLFPPDTGYPEKLLLEDAGRLGTVTGLSKKDKAVVRVKWDPGSYRIFGDFVFGASGHLEVADKGRVDRGSIESDIHADFIEVVTIPSKGAPAPQEPQLSPVGAAPSSPRESRIGLIVRGVWRRFFGLSLSQKTQCYREMRDFVDASIAAAGGMAARQRAIFRAAEKWGISWKVADRIFEEGRQKGWT